MKRIVYLFILLFLPVIVFADGVDNYYINATIESDGSLLVEEYFTLTGSYNGFERKIYYTNPNATKFNINASSYGGSTLHNGSSIELISVGSADKTFPGSFSSLNIDTFSFDDDASSGDYGVYYYDSLSKGIDLWIYNPSKRKKAFYIKYRIKDMAILFNDVGELGWNVVGSEFTEDIDNLSITLNIPNNTTVRAWAHGPLNGIVDINSSTKVTFLVTRLSKGTAIDIRSTFDTSVISNSTKKYNTNALDKILVYEEEQASIANEKRNQDKTKNEKIINYIGWIIGIIFLIILIYSIFYIYFKYKKRYKADSIYEYLRDIPDDSTPEQISYLFNKSISNNALSASIMDLIRRKIILQDKVEDNNYSLMLNANPVNLSSKDKYILKLIFRDSYSITTEQLKINAASGYEEFVNDYNNYKKEALISSINKEYYEQDIEDIKNGKSIDVKAYPSKKIFMSFFLYILSETIAPIIFITKEDILLLFLHFIRLSIFALCIYIIYFLIKNIRCTKMVITLVFIIIISTIYTFYLKLFNSINNAFYIHMIIILLSFIILVWYAMPSRRTYDGELAYKKWKSFRRFLKHFGDFSTKEVPDITLWEKYLVYATLFGCAKEVSEAMNIVIGEYGMKENIDFYFASEYITKVIYNCQKRYRNKNSFLLSSDNNYSDNTNSSKSSGSRSSGSGGGGGFSSGGGSFGGGGGGGRF